MLGFFYASRFLAQMMSNMLRLMIVLGSLCCLFYGLYLTSQHIYHFGTFLIVILGIICLLYAYYFPLIQKILLHFPLIQITHHFLWIVFILWIISLGYFFYNLKQNTAIQPISQQSPKAIIILGGGIQNTQPTPILKQRLDVAAKLFQQHPSSRLIVTGGTIAPQKLSEAEVMSAYLIQHHSILPAHILIEDQSTSTALNFKYSQVLLQHHKIQLHEPIAVVSSDFHLPRSKAIAQKQGYQQLIMIAAPTPLNQRYAMWLREYFAYISGFILKEY